MEETTMILAQIDAVGGISAQWVITVMGAILGYFGIQTLIRIDKNQKELANNQKELAKDQKLTSNVLLQMISRMSTTDDYFEDLAKQLNQK